ncbi:DoxX family protein [Microtetraspora sp. AC03309]|uniref:DoxX family protein n=1 Tax=Microtetraspora sp. AC03309 TaxID=2779376 RepID=UPI001E2A1C82|nr:DoxX family protein [Microtetraspora sp. AC03309]MCC5582184.1 DoxX family protein [Microtetraspora sp. AC03309]
MNVFLWILQALLAAMFAMAGATKSTRPKHELAAQLPWVEDFSPNLIRFIGAAELTAALGLILPAATGIATILTPIAATGLAIIMAGAIVTHARRNEPQAIAFNTALLIAAAVIAWFRFGPYSL